MRFLCVSNLTLTLSLGVKTPHLGFCIIRPKSFGPDLGGAALWLSEQKWGTSKGRPILSPPKILPWTLVSGDTGFMWIFVGFSIFLCNFLLQLGMPVSIYMPFW